LTCCVVLPTLCRDFLNLASRLLDSTFDLIFVDAHAISPAFRRQTATRPSLA